MNLPSLSNSLSKLIRSLHRRKGRNQQGAFLAEGERLIREMAEHPAEVEFLFGVEEKAEWLQETFGTRFPIHRVSWGNDSLFATENAQGVGAVVKIPEPIPLQQAFAEPKPWLYLDALADPGNVGTIIRTAAWFGWGGVMLGESTADLYNPKTVRATMGALFTLPICTDVAVAQLAQSGRPLVALDGNGATQLGQTALPLDGIFVVGNEAHGISEQVRQRATLVRIPGIGAVESLNAAMASSILCYELFRQQSS
ncbi:MAG: RNA methyltransferase [Chlorobi bacterium]|jgi:TrmH family RNA methyltransferase|nr:RNA methyltransferase [Chlorobiota bacterium]